MFGETSARDCPPSRYSSKCNLRQATHIRFFPLIFQRKLAQNEPNLANGVAPATGI